MHFQHSSTITIYNWVTLGPINDVSLASDFLGLYIGQKNITFFTSMYTYCDKLFF